MRFLVIDDDPVFLAVAEAVLESVGDHQVATAADGAAGLDRLASSADGIDAIILDLNMPRLDGLGFMRAAAEAGFAGKVIISSGESGAVINSAMRLGQMLGIEIAGSLRKPLTASAVAALLAGLAEKPSTPDEAARPIDASSLDTATIVPFYQPQFDIRTGRIAGFEALARAEMADGTIHGPRFIFDRLDGMAMLTRFTLDIADKALRDLAGWSAVGKRTRVSINLDVAVLERPGFDLELGGLARKHGVAPDQIVFEMTETTLTKDIARLIEVLARLRMAGFGLSVDDFGTGGSNFDMLRMCPFTELKIDRSIVQSAANEAHSRRFLIFCVETARDLDLAIVAEGVETEEELRIVSDAGADLVQGYLTGRPAPAASVDALLNAPQAPGLPSLF